MASAGPLTPGTRSTARSNSGSKTSTVAAWYPVVSSTLIEPGACDHVGIGDDQARRGHEPRAFLDLPAADRHHLDRRESRQQRRLPYLGRVRVGDGPGQLDQAVGYDLQTLVAQETLGGGEGGRDRGHDVGDGPDDLRVVDLAGDEGELAVHKDRSQQPDDDEGTPGGDDGPAHGVGGTVTGLTQPAPQSGAQLASPGSQHRRRHEQQERRDDRLRVLAAQMRAHHENEHDPDSQPGQGAAIGENLHRRPAPKPTEGRRQDDDDEYDVESVHAQVDCRCSTGGHGRGPTATIAPFSPRFSENGRPGAS